jgi:hypothetical protein
MNNAEVELIKAEANVILGNMEDARGAFEQGIRTSMNQLDVTLTSGVDQAYVDGYVSGQLDLFDDASSTRKIAGIITHKYIANFVKYQAYNDWRRTGFPELSPAGNAATEGGVIPLRFPYPNSEYTNNANNVPTDLGRGVQALDTPVPWDQPPAY